MRSIELWNIYVVAWRAAASSQTSERGDVPSRLRLLSSKQAHLGQA